MPTFTDPNTRDRLAVLHNRVRGHDTEIADLEDRIAATRQRRGLLDDRLAGELGRSIPADDATADLAAALAADPGAAIEGEAVASLKRSRAATAAKADTIAAIGDVVAGARSNVDTELDTLAEDLAATRADRDAAWREFVREAQAALVDEFRQRFTDLHESVIGPLIALTDLKAPGEPHPIVDGLAPRITADSQMKLWRGSTAFPGEYLMAAKEGGGGQRVYYPAYLDPFIAALG